MRRLLALSLLLSGCTHKETVVHLKVDAKTNQGEPVAAASVAIDGKKVGDTDNHGQFAGDVNLPAGAKRRLEVKKDSDTYYFAPYYEGFVIGEKASEDLAFNAVLYFVPKPSPTSNEAAPASAASKVEAVSTPVVAAEAPKPDVAELAPADAATVEAPPTQGLATAPAATAAVPPPLSGGDQPAAVTEETPEDVTVAAAPPAAKPATNDETDEVPVAETPSVIPAAPVAQLPAQALAALPKAQHLNAGQTLFTVHVFAGETPVDGAEIFLGEEQSGGLTHACLTNARGRCAIRFPEKPDAPVTFVATKKGFKTASVAAAVKDKDKLRINLDRGQTVDIYALTKAYSHAIGLKDVEVYVAGKHVGETDRFGRYSYVYEGKADDLLAISLKPRGFMPETFETDFVASGPMTLVKYFTPEQPPPVRLTILAPVAAGSLDKAPGPELDDAVRAAARKQVFASSAFKEYPLSLYERSLRRIQKSSGDVLRSGWHGTEMKAAVDGILLPTLVVGTKPALELSVVGSKGEVLAAAKEDLDGPGDKSSIDRAMAVLAKQITRAFPFEGAVTAKDADKVTINIGSGLGRGIKAGDSLDVYGVQLEKMGRSQLFGKIATLTVKEVSDQTSTAAVTKLLPRATIERGDLVVLRPRKVPVAGAAEIRVTAAGPKAQPVAQANLYFNDFWIGASDETGRVFLNVNGSGTLKVIKQGFADYAKPVTVARDSHLDVALKREAAFLRVASTPSGAMVKIDGKPVGKTPLSAGVPVPTGFVKLEIDAPAGYKTYTQVLELDQGTLDLTGEAQIALEPDFRALADKQLKGGHVDEALAILNKIPKEHSDYLLGRHEAGEIYLTMLDQPAKAAEAFGAVTSNEAVKEFADKRFIGSHINEGVALFLTAERLSESQPEAARAHYEKALQVLEAVVPHLRFVPSDQYAQAVHNVDYHRALCRHRLWTASQDPRMLAETVKTWRSYLDGSARSVPVDGTSKTYVENAEVYFKQATASLNAAKGVSRQ